MTSNSSWNLAFAATSVSTLINCTCDMENNSKYLSHLFKVNSRSSIAISLYKERMCKSVDGQQWTDIVYNNDSMWVYTVHRMHSSLQSFISYIIGLTTSAAITQARVTWTYPSSKSRMELRLWIFFNVSEVIRTINSLLIQSQFYTKNIPFFLLYFVWEFLFLLLGVCYCCCRWSDYITYIT